jgi:hypothetical protein
MSEIADIAKISGDGINADIEGFVTNSVTVKTDELTTSAGKDGNDANDAVCHYHRDRKAVGSVKDAYAPGYVPLCSECLSEGDDNA